MTKALTATAAMQLVEQGKLKLETTCRTPGCVHCPGFFRADQADRRALGLRGTASTSKASSGSSATTKRIVSSHSRSSSKQRRTPIIGSTGRASGEARGGGGLERQAPATLLGYAGLGNFSDLLHRSDFFTLRARVDPFSAVWASLRWRSGDERDDGVMDGRQAGSRRRFVDSFFPASLV
jgi:hypothetical protein